MQSGTWAHNVGQNTLHLCSLIAPGVERFDGLSGGIKGAEEMCFSVLLVQQVYEWIIYNEGKTDRLTKNKIHAS